MKQQLIALILTFIVPFAQLLQAASVTDGINAYQEGDYDLAFETLSAHAKQGDPQAQFTLGLMYFKGLGAEKDHAIAVDWLLKSGRQGFADAQYNLGRVYVIGIGAEKDQIEGINWYLKAAKQEHMHAMTELGLMYFNGIGFERDYSEALRWFRVAAEKGSMIAQFHIGTMYQEGLGVDKSHERSVRWFLLSANQGYAPAQTVCGLMQLHGVGLPKNKIEAANWFRKAIAQGDKDAEKFLAKLSKKRTRNPNTTELEKGYDAALDGNYEKALSIFLPLAKEGDVAAQYNMAVLYFKGRGVSKDFAESEKWARKSAEQGDPRAQTLIGMLYQDGLIGGKQDEIEAAKWYRKAADQEYGDAQLRLAFILSTEHSVTRNQVEAKILAQKAAAQGIPMAARLATTFSEEVAK